MHVYPIRPGVSETALPAFFSFSGGRGGGKRRGDRVKGDFNAAGKRGGGGRDIDSLLVPVGDASFPSFFRGGGGTTVVDFFGRRRKKGGEGKGRIFPALGRHPLRKGGSGHRSEDTCFKEEVLT